MSYLGKVFNKALSKMIPVVIAEGGESFIRLTEVISQEVKELAFDRTKKCIESDNPVFNDEDMKQIEKIVIK